MQLTKVGDLGRFIRDQRRNARLSLRRLSSMAGISNPYLSQIERGLRRPSAEILQAIAKALRISAESLYVKAGILEERGETADPVTSILRDLTLTEKQKQVLIEIYQTFRHGSEDESGPEAAKAVALAKTTRRRAPKPRPAAKRKAKRAPAKKPAARAPARKRTKKSAKTSAKKAAKTSARKTKARTTTTTRRGARGRARKPAARTRTMRRR